MKRLKLISNISFIIAFIALGVGASFHGYRIHQENEASYQFGVTKRNFTTEDFLDDYDYMWEILENEYPFFSIFEEQGVDVDNIKEATRQHICEQQPDIGGYYYILDRMFSKLNYFAHLQVVSPHNYEKYQKYYNHADNSSNGWKNVLQNEQVQLTYTDLLPQNVYSDSNFVYSEVEKSYDVQRKAVIFHIKSFDTSLIERDKNFVQDYLDTLEGAPVEHIVFDITGNQGGNDSYWMDNIAAPFGGSYTLTTWNYLRETPLTESYYFNDFTLMPISGVSETKSNENFPKPMNELPEEHKIPEFVEQLELTHFIRHECEYTWNAQLDKEVLSAKRWILIDKQVYSSADNFSYFCKATGWATLVGQSTLGDGMGTSPVLVALPNTGLLIRFSATAGESTSGRLNTLYGTEPDYYSGKYENPLSTLFYLIDGEK